MANENSLKDTAKKGFLWSALDKFAAQAGQFVISIVLARILVPEDFGLIGMLSIFIAISDVFVNSGMSFGLIQKQERSDVDFSTVFVFNLLISILFYLGLFVCAPYIADFYEEPILSPLTRVLGFSIIVNALAVVQRSKLTIIMDFKSIAKANIISIFGGGALGLVLGFLGYGVWALALQTITTATIAVILLWYLSPWKPSLKFSKSSFNYLFNFGYKLLLAGLYAQVLQNIYNLIIGKSYTTAALGHYTRAKSFAVISSGTLSSIMQQVTFPLLASVQDDEVRMVKIYKKLIKMSAFIVFPLMTLLAVLSEPLVLLLLKEKWRPVIPLLQWYAFARILYPLSVINMTILNVVGRSDLYLKVDLSKFPLFIIVLLISIPYGVEAMVVGQVIIFFFSFFIEAYLPGKMFDYGGFSQLKDIWKIIISTILMAFTVLLINNFIADLYLQFFIGGIMGIICYVIFCLIFKIPELKEIKTLLRKDKIKTFEK